MTMLFTQEAAFHWLSQYAYQPIQVYLFVFGMMGLSAFGLPVPEEVTIVSVGLLSYMGAHPETYPPPYIGAPVVNPYQAAVLTLIAVVIADCLVFSLGRTLFGKKLLKTQFFQRLIPPAIMEKIFHWLHKYGLFGAFIFRFTPGVRFPGHIALGTSRFSAWKFLLMDFLAAIVSVPTQIILIFHFGEPILRILKGFKNVFFLVLFLAVMVFVTLKLWKKRKTTCPS